MKRTLAVLALIALGGCAGAGSLTPSATAPLGGSPARSAAQSATALPGENAMGLPGENAMGLPGENAMGLPGARFGCTGVPAPGSADCTIAVNLNVSPNADPSLPPAQIPGLHPADLLSAYGFAAQNAGGTVAIVDAYDAPAAEADLAVYRAAFGLPACTSRNGCFKKVNQAGLTTGPFPGPDAGWAEETALDLAMVSAACPKCSIVLVEANSAQMDDLGAAVDAAAGLGASAISNSYYAPEWKGEKNEDVHYRHPGIAVTAASGDRGYASYPAASGNVIAVGGTSLQRAAGGGWTETPWKYAGHGCSNYEPTPAFQSGTPTHCWSRSAVDVATVADPATGVSFFATASGGWLVAGGTSVGAPLIAAAYALAGHPADIRTAYRHPGAFHDVAPAGYDAVTGLGTPNGMGGF